ncbi:MAG: dihydroneopterin aldolase [Peptococcaceae bacterium]|nr:dihydroneopterin aldolase [Peptococcaceae bacterium]
MDKLVLSGLQLRGFHGVLPEEQTLGQLFVVDLEMEGEFALAAASDNLDYSVNYAQAYKVVKLIVEERRFKLIETLAETIAQSLLEEFVQLQRVLVRVNKPHAPIPGIFSNVAIEVVRGRIK